MLCCRGRGCGGGWQRACGGTDGQKGSDSCVRQGQQPCWGLDSKGAHTATLFLTRCAQVAIARLGVGSFRALKPVVCKLFVHETYSKAEPTLQPRLS
jgi:hypothetical protein